MTRSELKKVLVVEKIIGKHLTIAEGAAALGLSERQVKRLKKNYVEKGGAQALAHGNRGRTPKHALSVEVKEKTVTLYTGKYHGSNNCHFSELLEEHESLQISPSSVRRILLAKGIKQAKQRRRAKAHQPRQRRAQAGMLWQIDATPYAWLEDRAPAFALHAAIDDATSMVVGAVFRPNECREGYSRVMQQGIRKYGVPLSLYSDRHMIFRLPNEKLTVEQELAGEVQPLSNFGKAMAELRIEHIKAVTPQAKGRVERLWLTLQDRLVVELRLLGVNTIEEANAVLPKLIEKHNRQFAVAPRKRESAYFELDPATNLEHVFAKREYRQLGSGNTFSYNSTIYTLADPSSMRLSAKMTVEVRETLDGIVLLWIQGKAHALKATERAKRYPQTKEKAGFAQPRKPASSHPWKTAVTHNQSKRTTSKSKFQDALYSQHNSYFEATW